MPKYEAWQIGGHRGELLICGPRGDLVHFPPLRLDDEDAAGQKE